MACRPGLAHETTVSSLAGYQWISGSWGHGWGEQNLGHLGPRVDRGQQQEGEQRLIQLWLPSSCFAHCHHCGPSSSPIGPTANQMQSCCHICCARASSLAQKAAASAEPAQGMSLSCCHCVHWVGARLSLCAPCWIWSLRSPVVWMQPGAGGKPDTLALCLSREWAVPYYKLNQFRTQFI